jgi:6-pyruvoyltetrahydropterin/6-carboxytetrahydropterin synthase
MGFKVNKWIIDKQFDFCFGHRVWSQELNTKYSLDGCLACRHLHGHQGKVKLFLGANDLNKGMVTDFKHTNIFKKWLDDVMDHKFVIDVNDPLFSNLAGDILLTPDESLSWYENLMVNYNSEYGYARPDLDHIADILSKLNISDAQKQAIFEKYEGLIVVNFIPTSERLCQWWYEVANKLLNGLGIDVVAVEYWETPKSHCRYQPE